MLPGEAGLVFEESEAEGFVFLDDLGFGHLVEGLDGDFRVFAAVFEEVDFSAGLEGFAEGGEHLGGVGELVVGIDHEGGVEGVGGEADGFDGAEVGLDVGDAEFGGFGFEVVEHFLLDVDGDDLAFRNEGGDAEAVVAGASADIGDDGVRGETEHGDGFGGGFFLFALSALQPADAGVAHDVRDFPAHEDFPDAVAGGGGGGVAGKGDWWRLSGRSGLAIFRLDGGIRACEVGGDYNRGRLFRC